MSANDEALANDPGIPLSVGATETVKARSDVALGHMPQLDTLRAFAVLLVIVSHWLPRQNAVVKFLPLGMIGVTLFFVLSGFLITQILLVEKAAIDIAGGSSLKSLGRFYARRTLRIFPIYYLTLLLMYLSGVAEFRGNLWWYVSYTANILFYHAQSFRGPAPHLWTLSVEEQFYILWPLLILITPSRHLRKLIFATILCGPISRGILFYLSSGSNAAGDFLHLLTPTCMDCFGLGALLAYHRSCVNRAFRFELWPWWLFLGMNVVSLLLLKDSYSTIAVWLTRFNISVVALALIDRASLGFAGRARLLMENPVLMYLGKISYGLYLFHIFIPDIYRWLGLPVFASGALTFATNLCLLVLLASASWQFFESPVNSLKKRFSYPVRAAI